ncbi:bile acid:sodium symporter family protein [Saccharopolyspora cebuensis]|uniref:Bile acid:sodium symporter family protein n=1 Tax=Saccharopolyspora cebuensis TaxID=418759 RepID=A0ABV4CR15_9PSEU
MSPSGSSDVLSPSRLLARLRLDPYVVALLCAAGVAALLPVRGAPAEVLGVAVKVAIGLLFFLYGTRLSPSAAWDGVRQWRLHGLVLLITYAVFPMLGLALGVLVPSVLAPELHLGVLFLCVLPSTVQSAITFTSVARGNVAAAICQASFSNVLGVFLTPLLAGLLVLSSGGGITPGALRDVVVLLLAPFAAGLLLRPVVGPRLRKHAGVLGLLDRGVILVVVYLAFSRGTAAGIWDRLSPRDIGVLLAVCAVLLTAVLLGTGLLGRWCGFARQDRVVLVLCGSNKSLASGLPMATVLFAGSANAGLIVLPLMLYHQMQLITCAWMARRFARSAEPAAEAVAPVAAAQLERGGR